MSNVDVPTALHALSKTLSAALGKPEAYVMVQLDLDTPMIFQASDAPCAFIHIRSIGRIGPDLNPKTAASLTATAAEVLKSRSTAFSSTWTMSTLPTGPWPVTPSVKHWRVAGP
ncbi:hypothetical protein PI124_g4218 [Phytophthora idaei]|nr:hypothetical protein PI125_g3732 [Phytophthora idaei]KAG3167075.1 hypothetical protein PI126_g3923 [Phytophthora idaei]KAG3251201.1 hypothetical protein PI124_g4218 [Phytophthora idaei]